MVLSDKDLTSLRADYERYAADAHRLLSGLKEQLEIIVAENDIALAVPIETRVKTWDSVRGKIERKGQKSDSILQINDLAGIRLITLFTSDVRKLDAIIRGMLTVMDAEDTVRRLDDSQFGYLSNHYTCRLPEAWLTLPSYKGLGSLPAELQLRTLAQHMWAAASHKLQYKREDSAPLPLRRSINRVSAILEMVDLEFSRILIEASDYIKQVPVESASHEPLNVLTIEKVLDDIFPEQNKATWEDVDDLLKVLQQAKVEDVKQFRDLMVKGRDAALASDQEIVERERKADRKSERIARGVFFQHVGLAREALRHTLGGLPTDK